MSAIAAALGLGAASARTATAALAGMSHRVHDEIVVLESGDSALGVQLTPDSSWAQTGGWTVVLSGWVEIGGIEIGGASTVAARLNTDPDAEFIGEFCFAAHHARSGQWRLEVDHLAMRPLYLRPVGGGLVVAGEAAGCVAVGPKPVVRPASIRQLLRHGALDLGVTVWTDVERLLPGHMLTNRSATPVQRWKPVLKGSTPGQLRSAFEAAVDRRIPNEGAFDIELSGGLDSSAIAGWVAAGPHRDRATLVSLASDEPRADEREFQIAVAEELKLPRQASPLALEPVDLVDWSRTWRDITPAPNGWMWAHLREEESARTWCCLGGNGGDQVYGQYTEDTLRAAGRFAWRDVIAEAGTWAEPQREIRRLVSVALGLGPPSPPWLAPDRRTPDVWPPWQIGHRRRFANFASPGMADSLGDSDRFGALYGVTTRSPFLDRHVVDAALALPAEYRIGRGDWRGFQKENLAGVIPQSVADRRDFGYFSVTYEEAGRQQAWLTENSRLASLDYLTEGDLGRWAPPGESGPTLSWTVIAVEAFLRSLDDLPPHPDKLLGLADKRRRNPHV